MKIDVLLDTFGATWEQVRAGALAAEANGMDGIWFWDHLSGVVHDEPHVLECWTVLTSVAVSTSRVTIGPLVLNQANRPAGVLAQMASTLQQISGGRLLLGLGAGTGPGSRYAQEQRLLGRDVPPDARRRENLRQYVAELRRCWSGQDGFLAPDSHPPIVIGALGPKMARLASEVGDGVNVYAELPETSDLLATAATDKRPFLRTVYAPMDERWPDRLATTKADRLIFVVPRPYLASIDAIGRQIAKDAQR
jgi:alkanesulfonate monooxygenase SsuD/methylene tetrahydromethanopterin reductase-like flavin-dependent oxidoreductase (luciferase family)